MLKRIWFFLFNYYVIGLYFESCLKKIYYGFRFLIVVKVWNLCIVNGVWDLFCFSGRWNNLIYCYLNSNGIFYKCFEDFVFNWFN